MISPVTLQKRASIIQAIRLFFTNRDYLEVDTPIRLPAIIPESYIVPETSEYYFLQTSPEICMKRMLAAGCNKIFQISKCFRRGERGSKHLPEFTMLEWYHSGWSYLELMDETAELLQFVARQTNTDNIFTKDGQKIALHGPWEKITIKDAFSKFTAVTIDEAIQNDSFEELLVEQIEPHLGKDSPAFLYDYPSTMGSLARTKGDDPSVAERFELYINGIELANGFSELTDAKEQRQRFLLEQDKIKNTGREPGPLPEKFLADLIKMPESAGIALGIDRLIMLLLDKRTIDEVVSFIPEEL